MAAPYREAACGGCGAQGAREEVGLCDACLRDTAARAKRILDAVTPSPRAWSRFALAASLGALGVVSAIAVVYAANLRSLERLVEMRTALPQAQTRTEPEPPRAPAAPPPQGWRAEDQAVMPWPPHLLATSGAPTHDGAVLLDRARKLARAGVDLPVLEVTLPSPQVPFQSFVIEPYTYRGAGVVGVRLVDVRPGGDALGLRAGDVLTAVDGWPVDRDRDEWASALLAPSGTAVLEVLRVGGPAEPGAPGERRRVVIAVHWRPS